MRGSTVDGLLSAWFVGPGMAAEPAADGLTGVWLLDQSVFDGATDPTREEIRR